MSTDDQEVATEGNAKVGIPPARLAIIITCWNYADYVAKAIESVLAQDLQGCEFIVIDDGSTDGSWDVIGRYPVKAIRTANGGQLSACLCGLSQTSARHVLFLDADDELEKDAISTILAHLDAQVAKLQFALTRIDGDGIPTGHMMTFGNWRENAKTTRKVLQDGVYATPPTSGNVFRRDVCLLLNDVDYDRAVDGVILFAAPFLGDIVSLDIPLARYRVHGRNDSGLGRPLDAASLRRDIRRFRDRTEHLRRFLSQRFPDARLIETEKAYFHLERSFYLAIAEGKGVLGPQLTGLIRALWRQDYPAQAKLMAAAFFLASSILPNALAQNALLYRLTARNRSPLGAMKALLRQS